MRLSFLFVLLMLLLGTHTMTAQRSAPPGLESTYFKKSGPLRTNGVISGYYMINYHKAKGETGYYVLQLFDQELNKVGEKPFPPDEDLRIGAVAYNGERLGVEMLDHAQERKWIEIFNGKGEFQHRRQMTYSIMDAPEAAGSKALLGGQSMVAADGGFLHFNMAPDGKLINLKSYYRVTYIPNEAENRGWSTRSSARSDGSQGAIYLTSNDSLVVFGVYTRVGSILTGKCTMGVVGYGLHSGKKLFSYTPERKELQTRFLKGKVIGNELVVVGTSVGKSSKLFTDHPTGIDVIRLSLKGKVLEKATLSIADDLTDYFDVSRKGKIKGIGNLFIHDIGITERQEIVIAGEFYKVSHGDIKAKQGLLVHLRPDLSVATVKLIEKGITRPMSTIGLATARGPIVAALGKMYNRFDFAFLDEGKELVTTTFFSGSSQAYESGHMSLYVHTLLDGELVADKVEFTAASDWVIVLPAKEGYLAVIEYNEDSKSLDVHMERLRL